MDGFGLILGHMLGDYILQNDWMAANKVNPAAGPHPGIHKRGKGFVVTQPWTYADEAAWYSAKRKWHLGNLACFVHCLLYTLAVWACSFWWMPWWGLAACFALHFPVDRWRLARWWMLNVSGQRAFVEKMAPWSVAVVDNTFHLLVLFLIAACAGRVG